MRNISGAENFYSFKSKVYEEMVNLYWHIVREPKNYDYSWLYLFGWGIFNESYVIKENPLSTQTFI